jgi:hypothetical protein
MSPDQQGELGNLYEIRLQFWSEELSHFLHILDGLTTPLHSENTRFHGRDEFIQ